MKRMIRIIFTVSTLTLFFFTGNGVAQTSQPDSAHQKAKVLYQSVERLDMNNNTRVPQSIRGKLAANVNVDDIQQAKLFLKNSRTLFRINDAADDFIMKKVSKDDIGMTHAKVQQVYKGVPVFGSELVLHSDQSNTVIEVNGRFTPDLNLDVTPSVSSSSALSIALADLGPADYRWENPAQEKIIKDVFRDNSKTWKPNPVLVVAPRNGDFDKGEYRLAWKMTIPVDGAKMGNWEYFIDAKTGEIINKFNSMPDAVGSGVSNYNGTVTIYSHWTGTNYQMIDTIRSIYTYTANGQTVNPGTLLTDNDNYWDQNKAAVDAHWGTANVYDFYKNVFNRNSFDGAGAQIVNTVQYLFYYGNGQYDPNNAAWDGTQMLYGSGDGSNFSSVTALDVCGHELTHAVTDYTAGLAYQSESGALNEAISDIFGTAIEFYATPSKANWWVGEDCYTPNTSNDALRYMDNPNRGSQPDTYQGTDWAPTANPNQYNDYGGVHTNSGVLNYAFYLMSVGGSGTNDNGISFSVSGVGINKTRAIAYRALTSYLTTSSNFASARTAFLSSASDLYGTGGAEYNAVLDAFAAVGVGAKLTVANSFAAGTILVNGTTRNSGYSYPADIGSQQTYQAIPQHSGSYDYVWNTSGADASLSYWKKQPSGGLPSRITGATNITFTYTVSSSDNNATYSADMKRNFTITRNDQSIEAGTTINTVTTQVVEGNTLTAPLTQTVSSRVYYFLDWSDGVTQNTRTITSPTSPLTARYKGVHISNDASAFNNNGQRKFIRTTNGWYHQVYTSMGHVWIEHSSDGVNWTLGNGGFALDNGAGKLPSIDYNGDAVAVVFQEQTGTTWQIVVETFQLSGSNYSKGIRVNVWLGTSPYSSNVNPNLAWKTANGTGVCMITWESGGIYYYYGRLEALSLYQNTWGQLAGTDANSINASLYTVKSDQSQTPTWQIAWQQRVGSNYGSVKYAQFALYKNDTWIFTWVFAPSQISSSSVMNNYQPSMICDVNNNWYACWIGDVNGTGDPTSVKVIYTNKSAKSSNVYYMYGMNTMPKSCAINISSTGVGCYFAWSASQPSYSNKLVDVGNTGVIKTLNTSGKDIQMCGGAQAGMSVLAYYPFSTPYYFAKSNNLTSFFPKSSPNMIASERGCFIGKGDAHLFYSFGNMLVNNMPVDFVDAPDTAKYDGLEKINAVLVSQPIQITPTSRFTFTELSTSTDSSSLMSVLADTGYVRYRIDLVDNATGGVIGTVKNTMLTKANAVEESGTTYLLDTKNIGTRTVKAKITISTNLDNPDVALVKSFSETNAVAAASPQSLTLQPVAVVTDYSLDQNFPNPFNPSTQISYSIPKDGMVTLKIFDALGREVETLVNEAQKVGRYQVTFDGSRLSSGVYFYRMQSRDFVETKKLMLIK